jgi:superfamily II DNA or RNA helicase
MDQEANSSFSSESGSSSPNSEIEKYEYDLSQIVEESKFQKHGKYIIGLLNRELCQIRKGIAGRSRFFQYQIEAVLKTAEHFDNNELEESPPALISAPPGSGKSGMITLLPYVLFSSKVLILTPSVVISDQIAESFGFPKPADAFFLKCGLFSKIIEFSKILERVHIAKSPKDVKAMTYDNLCIVNAQKFGGNSSTSLSSKKEDVVLELYDKLNEFDTILIDEAHHYPAQTWKNIIDFSRGKKVVFFTATPFRNHGGKIMHMTEFANVQEVYSISRNILEGIIIHD